MQGTSRSWFWGVATLVAVALCFAIALTRFQEVERTRALERRLATLERENEKAILKLYRQLTLARSDVQRLSRRVRRSEQQNRELVADLLKARSSAAELEDRMSSLADPVRDDPPAIAVRIQPETGGRLVAVAENRGRDGLQIVESRGFLWLGGRSDEVPGSFGPLEIPPRTSADFFEYSLPAASPRLADGSENTIEGTLCLALERSASDGPGTWVEERRFDYRLASGTVAVLDHVSEAISPDTPACPTPVTAALR